MSTKLKAVILGALLLTSLVFASTSHAALCAVGPVDPATGLPAWYQDCTGLSLAPCFDNNGFCSSTMKATPNFNPILPMVFPSNWPEQGFYFKADAMTDTGTLYMAALEFAYGSARPTRGQELTFARTRVVDVAAPAGTYTITHPFGVETIEADAGGIRFTNDVGLGGPPFTGVLTATNIGPFLRCAGGCVGGFVTAPDGNVYIGNSVTAIPVTGTAVTSLTVAGPISGTANTFILEGKVVGMSVTPKTITFPAQKPGIDSEPVLVTMANLSLVSTLTIASIVPQGPNAADFRIVDVNCLTAPVAPGGVCTFNVIFNGVAAGPAARTGSIVVSATLATVPKVAVISVSGTVDIIPPVVVSTYPADGATVPVTSTPIMTITAVFSEPMLETSLTATTFTLQGSTGAMAGIVTYDAGSNTATFSPTPFLTSIGTYTATITTGVTDLAGYSLAANKAWQFAIVALPAPNITVTDSVAPADDHLVPFGSVNQGGSSAETVTVTNSGNADLVIGTIMKADPFSPFSIAPFPCSGTTITPAGSCTLSVGFIPSAVGTFTDKFDIPSNDPNTPIVIVNASGTGTPVPVPDIAVTDSVFPENDLIIPFGNVTQGVSSPVQTINITNAGTAALTVSNIQLTGTDANQFGLNLGGGSTPRGAASPTLAAGGNCTVTVTFSPLSAGAKSSNLAITSNDPDEAAVSVALTGTGLPASTNNAPSVPALVYPANGQAGLSTSFTCRWKKSQDPDGDPVTYHVYYCPEQNFNGCTADTAANLGTHGALYAYAGLPGLLLLGAIFAVPRSGRKKFMLLMISLIMIGGVVVSCGGGGGGGENPTQPATDEASHLMSGLKSATTYYWKVVADDGKGGTQESAVWSFMTQ